MQEIYNNIYMEKFPLTGNPLVSASLSDRKRAVYTGTLYRYSSLRKDDPNLPVYGRSGSGSESAFCLCQSVYQWIQLSEK